MLSPQSQLMERNLSLFNEGNWLIINPADAYFADLLSGMPVSVLHQYFDVFAESVKVIPNWTFDSRDINSAEHGFVVAQKVGPHQHYFAPFIPAGETFSDILIYLPKSKAHLNMLVAMAHAALSEGGRIHIVGENRSGIKSVAKILDKLGDCEKVDSARHCSLVTLSPTSTSDFDSSEWLTESEFSTNDVQWQVVSMPGVFSHGELDDGTQLLLEKFSSRFQGSVLDFACGAGVIGANLLKRFPHLKMTMIDVSAQAIYCSALTLAANGQAARLIAANGLHGVDESFSHIVTNPPFHTGVKTDYTITKRFIQDSRRCLVKDGSMLMVANRFLPYPGLLSETFSQVQTVAQNSRFSLYLTLS